MVGSELLELNAAEKMDIRGMGAHVRKIEGYLRLGDRLILLGIIDEALLDKITAAAAPTCPETKFEESYRQRRRGDRTDHADERLLAAEFRADIFAEYRRLQVG